MTNDDDSRATSVSSSSSSGNSSSSSGNSSSGNSSCTENSGATAAVNLGSVQGRRGRGVLVTRSNASHWRKYQSKVHRTSLRHDAGTWSESCGTASQSNSQRIAAASDSSMSPDARLEEEVDDDYELVSHNTNLSADDSQQQLTGQSNDSSGEEAATTDKRENASETAAVVQTVGSDSNCTTDEAGNVVDQLFTNLDSSSQAQQAPAEAEQTPAKSMLANVIEKAILDFCSSRTVETMRRMFAGVTSELEALQHEAARSGDNSVQTPHPVTGDLVKEGIVIGYMDVFAPRVHREYRLEMKDCLIEGFLKDAGVFRSICYRTKCQLEVTRRLLNKKLCTGGRWVKYLIVRIVGPSHRAITCCDQLLQKALPAFKYRIEYPRAAFCRLFFHEDIPDNANLYHSTQRTGGTSNRYGHLRLETPYRATNERTVGNCPWKNGTLKIGKLSFSGAGTHLCMRQVYPGYGYLETTPVGSASKGADALHRIEHMHGEFLNRRQQLLQDRRAMTIPVCR